MRRQCAHMWCRQELACKKAREEQEGDDDDNSVSEYTTSASEEDDSTRAAAHHTGKNEHHRAEAPRSNEFHAVPPPRTITGYGGGTHADDPCKQNSRNDGTSRRDATREEEDTRRVAGGHDDEWGATSGDGQHTRADNNHAEVDRRRSKDWA
jgi:hypothetical protein